MIEREIIQTEEDETDSHRNGIASVARRTLRPSRDDRFQPDDRDQRRDRQDSDLHPTSVEADARHQLDDAEHRKRSQQARQRIMHESRRQPIADGMKREIGDAASDEKHHIPPAAMTCVAHGASDRPDRCQHRADRQDKRQNTIHRISQVKRRSHNKRRGSFTSAVRF